MRMQEAEKRMIQDDILTDDMLMVASGEFSRPRGKALFHLVVGMPVQSYTNSRSAPGMVQLLT